MKTAILALGSLLAFSSTIHAATDGGSAPPSGVTLPFYMNVAGDEVITSALFRSEGFRKDTGGYQGTSKEPIRDPQSGISDGLVYESWRGNKNGMKWSIPIANGTYDLTLMYQESYWGVTAGKCTRAGSKRQFDVIVEGVQVRDEFDICKAAGAPLTAVRDVVPNVIVSNGAMDIELAPGQGRDPKPQIAGIVITAAAKPTNTAKLSWSAPSTRTDATSLALSEIEGYRIYQGTSADNLSVVTEIKNSAVTNYTVKNLTKGKHYFAVTVYDTNDQESAFSTIGSTTVR